MKNVSNNNFHNLLTLFQKANINPLLLQLSRKNFSDSVIHSSNTLPSFLNQSGLHSFEDQPAEWGSEEFIETILLAPEEAIQTSAIVYRTPNNPSSHKFWIEGLDNFARPDHILGLTHSDGRLVVINCDSQSISVLNDPSSHMFKAYLSAETHYLNFEIFNHRINQFLMDGQFSDTDLYLDFEEGFADQVSSRLGIDPADFEPLLLQAVREKLNLQAKDPFELLIKEHCAWQATDPLNPSPVTAFLCATTIAAEKMRGGENMHQNNFYDRLLDLLEITADPDRVNFKNKYRVIEGFWESFNNWLIDNDGQFGHPTAYPFVKAWRFVSYSMSQALVREGDKQHLAEFLRVKRLSSSMDIDKAFLKDELSEWMRSTSPTKYLKNLWATSALQEKVIDATYDQLLDIDSEVNEEITVRLKLWARATSWPRSGIELSLQASRPKGFDANLQLKEAGKKTGAFACGDQIELNAYTTDLARLGPNQNIVMDTLLSRRVRLVEKTEAKQAFEYIPRLAIALELSEDQVSFKQITRPNVFAHCLILSHKDCCLAIDNFLKTCTDNNYSIHDTMKGIPESFTIFKNVCFVRPVSSEEIDYKHSAYWIRPALPAETISLANSLMLKKDYYHANIPPSLRIFSETEHVKLLYMERFERAIEQREIEVPIIDGVGQFNIPAALDGKNIEIRVVNDNFKPLRLAFRSSNTIRPNSIPAQNINNLSSKLELGIGSTNQSGLLESDTFVSGNFLENIEIDPEAPAPLSLSHQFIDDHFENELIDDLEFDFAERTIHEKASCVEKGYHIWKFPPGGKDRNGHCVECEDKIIIPKPRKRDAKTKNNKPASNQLNDKKNWRYKGNKLSWSGWHRADIFDAICYLQDLSWKKFQSICNPTADQQFDSYRLLKDLSGLGHIDISYNTATLKPERISCSRPVLLENNGVLSLAGFRNKDLITKISTVFGESQITFTDNDDESSLPLYSWDYPAGAASHNTTTGIYDIFKRELTISRNTGARLLQPLPSLSEVISVLPTVTMGGGTDLRRFNPSEGKWETKVEVERTPGAYHQNLYGSTYFIHLQDGSTKLATSELAKISAATFKGIRLHDYDPNEKEFISLIGCEPPDLYKRALISFSSQLPSIRGNKVYYKSIPSNFAAQLLAKLYF